MTISTCCVTLGAGDQIYYLNMYNYNGNGCQNGWISIVATNSVGNATNYRILTNEALDQNIHGWGNDPQYYVWTGTSNYTHSAGTNWVDVYPNKQDNVNDGTNNGIKSYLCIRTNFTAANCTLRVTYFGSGIAQLTQTPPS